MIQNPPEVYQRCWQLFRSGISIRTLSKHFNIPRSTIQYKFKITYGADYTQYQVKSGLIPIIDEYLNSQSLPPKQKQHLEEWKVKNLNLILEVDYIHKDTSLLTSHQEKKLTLEQTSHTSQCWSDRLNALKLTRQ